MRNMLDKTNQKLKNIERKNNKGFTLVELIIVIAIIAVLAAVLAPQYVKYIERSRQGVDANTISEVKHIVEVEAGITQNLSACTVTVSGADGTITVNGTAAAGQSLVSQDNIREAAGTVGAFKSKLGKTGTFTIIVSADGSTKYGTNTANAVTDLQSGSAKTVPTAAETE